MSPARCVRCGQVIRHKGAGLGLLGPDCVKLARAEAEAFVKKLEGDPDATLEEWFDECDADFASPPRPAVRSVFDGY